jgi:hypothetical protein
MIRVHGLRLFGRDTEKGRIEDFEILLQEMGMSGADVSKSVCGKASIMVDRPRLYASQALWIRVVEAFNGISILWNL